MKTKYKLIGSRAFYKTALAIAVPIMIQNGISNFVSMLDNLMIGRLGENAISGVAIANQLMFVYYLVIFGATAGVGIFTAQYYGMGDTEGVRYTFRFKLIANAIMTAICIGILLVFSSTLISLFLKGEGKPEDAAETLKIGLQYMQIMLIGLIPNGINQAYAGTLRDIGQTKVPMIASVIAIAVNFVGNVLLIYGLLGLPAMGARGAAIATVISRFVELGVLVVYTATHSKQHPFIIGAFRHFKIPGKLICKFTVNSLPLMANETLWSMGMTIMNQSYSYRSLEAVAALNIENTIWSLMGVAFLAMGEAVGILIGQKLGSGEIEEAKGDARKLIAFTVVCGTVFGVLMLAISPFFPQLYKVTDSIKQLATKFIIVYAAMMPFFAYTHAAYFTIRTGGKTWLTMLFDSCFVWLVSVPAAFILSRYTNINIVLMVAIVQSLELIKCLIGGIIVHSNIWARNIVGSKKEVS